MSAATSRTHREAATQSPTHQEADNVGLLLDPQTRTRVPSSGRTAPPGSTADPRGQVPARVALLSAAAAAPPCYTSPRPRHTVRTPQPHVRRAAWIPTERVSSKHNQPRPLTHWDTFDDEEVAGKERIKNM